MPDQIIKFEDGAVYEQLMGIWSQSVGLEFLEWLAPTDDQHWIDIGCGNGAFTEQIIRNCSPSKIQGIDPSDAQINFAKNRLEGQLASFQTGDAMELPFDSNQFDVATMALALFFVPEPMRGVQDMSRVVRTGGLVTAYVWDIFGGGFPLEPIHAEMRAMDIKHILPISAEVSRLENLENLWVDLGLKSVETCVITVERTFTSFSSFWDVALHSGTLKTVFEKLEKATKEDIKNATMASLKVGDEEQFTLKAHANAIKGIV